MAHPARQPTTREVSTMSETTLPGQGLTIEEYLEFEKTSPVKHKFVGGRLYTMTSTTKRPSPVANKSCHFDRSA